MTEITLLDRYKGAMVGVHAGDSVGARDEGKKPKEIAERLLSEKLMEPGDYLSPWDKKSGKRFPAGMPTDDSDQTAVLAHSLIECNGLNVEHLRKALQENVIGGKSLLWTEHSTGSGQTTQKALSDDPAEIAEAMNNNIGTNGSLMRSVPIGLLYSRQLFSNEPSARIEIGQKIHNMSSVTHAHWNSRYTCEIYCHALSIICHNPRNTGRSELRWQLKRRFDGLPLFERIYNSLNDEYWFPLDPGAWPARGTAEFSLSAALWCFQHAKSFADGIEKAVRIGGDTDTYAAIAGGLLGAYYGYEAIPLEWRQTILGHDVMVDYADKLYEMNQQL